MRRALVALCISGILMAASPSSALAWANGSPRDAFGTHDWVLYQAIRLAGVDAGWVDQHEALISTDDPDEWRDSVPDTSLQYRLEQPRHVYYPDSTKQGAPQAVTDHYALMVQALSAEDTVTASHELGYLSHYYSDILVPFHTFSYGTGSLEDGVDHSRYESAVGAVTQSPDARPDWIAPLPPRPVTDVRARTIEAATFSASKMLWLLSRYGSFAEYDPADDIQTPILLNRAANDLADIIRAAKTGAGLPRPIRTIQTWADYYYPALGRPARVWVKVKDDRGHPVRGVLVNFKFLVTQPCTYYGYTDADGIAHQTHSSVLGALGAPCRVVVTAASVGTTLTSTVVLRPTEIIGPGTSGVRTSTKYDATPAQGTTVTVMTHVQNNAGAPISGVKVVYRFKHASGTVKRTVYTNTVGNAWCSRNIGNSPSGRRVYVQADAYGGTQPGNTFGGMRTSSTSFVPHSKIASMKASRVTSATPLVSAIATVKVRLLDDHGRPIVGRIVKFDWKHKTGTAHAYSRTDFNGYARMSRKIGKAEIGYRMRVLASVSSGSKVKTSGVSFRPVRR